VTSKPPVYTRTYKLKSPANKGKINRIRDLVREYQDGLSTLVTIMDKNLTRNGALPGKYTELRSILNLSARQTQTCYTQARESYASWLRSLQKTVKRTITLSTLAPHTRDVLYRLNYHMAWYARTYELDWIVTSDGELIHPTTAERKANKTMVLPVSVEHLWLMRRIMKHARRVNHRPNLGHETTLKLDAKTAALEPSSGHTTFPWWLRSSTLVRGHPVLIPVMDNSFFAKRRRGGRLLNHVQLALKNDKLSVSTVVEKPCSPLREDGDVIAFDWGLVNLFTLPDGRMLGRAALTELKRLDALLMDRVRELTSMGTRLKGDSYYDALVSRSRSLMVNEIGRLLNLLARTTKEIIVEDLDFRGGGLSKRMNRILSRAGRGCMKQKLQALHEEKGIIITKVDPAYTSQECSACGHVSKRNRRDQARFRCVCCGQVLNADVNAARIIGRRPSDGLPKGQGMTHRKTLYDVLENRHRMTCGAWLARHTTAGL
jgi:putative transposase